MRGLARRLPSDEGDVGASRGAGCGGWRRKPRGSFDFTVGQQHSAHLFMQSSFGCRPRVQRWQSCAGRSHARFCSSNVSTGAGRRHSGVTAPPTGGRLVALIASCCGTKLSLLEEESTHRWSCCCAVRTAASYARLRPRRGMRRKRDGSTAFFRQPRLDRGRDMSRKTTSGCPLIVFAPYGGGVGRLTVDALERLVIRRDHEISLASCQRAREPCKCV